MRRFWKQRSEFHQLEGELRRERPRPRSDYLDTLAAQLQRERATDSHRPALRYRVAAAVVITGALGVVAAASGGLQYANTASTHTVKAVAHVFSSASTSESLARASHDTGASAPNSRGSVNQATNTHRSAAGSSTHVTSSRTVPLRSDNAARSQYVEFVFVCLRVPPRDPTVFITLRLPKIAADNLIARGIATLGPC